MCTQERQQLGEELAVRERLLQERERELQQLAEVSARWGRGVLLLHVQCVHTLEGWVGKACCLRAARRQTRPAALAKQRAVGPAAPDSTSA